MLLALSQVCDLLFLPCFFPFIFTSLSKCYTNKQASWAVLFTVVPPEIGWTVVCVENGHTLGVIEGRALVLSRYFLILSLYPWGDGICPPWNVPFSVQPNNLVSKPCFSWKVAVTSSIFSSCFFYTLIELIVLRWSLINIVTWLQDYAKTDGLEYICPHCSVNNFKRKSPKMANGFSHHTSTVSRPT